MIVKLTEEQIEFLCDLCSDIIFESDNPEETLAYKTRESLKNAKEETILNEEELDELAEKSNPHYNIPINSLEYTRWNSGFKAGYKKAKEE